jgi:hypothetical protein
MQHHRQLSLWTLICFQTLLSNPDLVALFWSLTTVIQVMAKVSYIIGCMNHAVHFFCSHEVTLVLVLVWKNRAASIQKTETMNQAQYNNTK